MGKNANQKLIGHLPLVLAATFAVVLAPMLLVLWLRESGTVGSTWVALAIGVGMSLVASQAGAAIWKSKANSELLFNELMLWGWLQRWRNERRLAAATDLLGLSAGRAKAVTGGQLSSEEKTHLLTQLTSGLESSDPYTHGHSRRVARHAANIAKQMGLSSGEIAKIRAAGAMHDVGKVETPTSVLHKAGRLTDEEFEIVKRHPVDGANMVATLDDDELTAIVRHHHERLDGTGYPDGLAGEEIPLGARILAVADTFDAITSTRPYRQANPHKKALDILTTEAGTQLDPDAVNAFLECYSGMKPVAFWAVLINARPRVGASLGQAFAPATGTNLLATTAAAAAVGVVGMGPGAHTLPSSAAQPLGASNAALVSSTAFSGDRTPTLTTIASMSADPDARASGDDATERRSKAVDRAGHGDTKAPSDTKVASESKDSPPAGRGHKAQGPGDSPSNRPSGGAGRPTKTGEGGNGNGNAHGREKPKKVPPGNAYGVYKPKPPPTNNGQGQGNANGQGQSNAQGPANGQGNANGQGQGTGQGQSNAQGNGNSGQANGNSGSGNGREQTVASE